MKKYVGNRNSSRMLLVRDRTLYCDSISNGASCDGAHTLLCVNVISIFLGSYCRSNNSVIWRTRQHMAAMYDQQPLEGGSRDMQMSAC